MFILFDKSNKCYGIYDKIEYVCNIIDIVHTLNPTIKLTCRKYHINTNSFDLTEINSKATSDVDVDAMDDSTKAYKSQLPRIENWYEKFESDLSLYNSFKINKDQIPLLFEEKYTMFSKVDELDKLDKFSIFIEKFYLKDNNDTSFYDLF